MKKYCSYKGEAGAPNILERHFEAEKPNQKWVTDVTSRDIVSYTISDRPVLSMVTSMLEKHFK